jgi:hypothetical protein
MTAIGPLLFGLERETAACPQVPEVYSESTIRPATGSMQIENGTHVIFMCTSGRRFPKKAAITILSTILFTNGLTDTDTWLKKSLLSTIKVQL